MYIITLLTVYEFLYDFLQRRCYSKAAASIPNRPKLCFKNSRRIFTPGCPGDLARNQSGEKQHYIRKPEIRFCSLHDRRHPQL